MYESDEEIIEETLYIKSEKFEPSKVKSLLSDDEEEISPVLQQTEEKLKKEHFFQPKEKDNEKVAKIKISNLPDQPPENILKAFQTVGKILKHNFYRQDQIGCATFKVDPNQVQLFLDLDKNTFYGKEIRVELLKEKEQSEKKYTPGLVIKVSVPENNFE